MTSPAPARRKKSAALLGEVVDAAEKLKEISNRFSREGTNEKKRVVLNKDESQKSLSSRKSEKETQGNSKLGKTALNKSSTVIKSTGDSKEQTVQKIGLSENIQNFLTRSIFGMLMGFSFLCLAGKGALAMTVLICFILAYMFGEVMNIIYKSYVYRNKLSWLSRALPLYFLSVTLIMMLTSALETPFMNTYPELFALVPPYKPYNFLNLIQMAFGAPNYPIHTKNAVNITKETSITMWMKEMPFNVTTLQTLFMEYRLSLIDRVCALFAILYICRRILVFSLYIAGIVMFVMSLEGEHYRYQFRQFSWTIMSLIFVVMQGLFQINNIFRGMIWFLVPCTCVIQNDIWAYMCGKAFGRTKLLRLSPKKTLEGFVGAFFFTLVWGWWFSGFLSKFPAMICPKLDFVSPVTCPPNSLFEFYETPYPEGLRHFLANIFANVIVFLHHFVSMVFSSRLLETLSTTFNGRALPSLIFSSLSYGHNVAMECFLDGCTLNDQQVMMDPFIRKCFSSCLMQYHALAISVFCAVIAPFGGFFASGLKRAHKLKDFGTLIPGHGGMTDRMDCQCTTGLFIYLYIQAFILPRYYNGEYSALTSASTAGVASLAGARAVARAQLFDRFGGNCDDRMMGHVMCPQGINALLECTKYIANIVVDKKDLLLKLQEVLGLNSTVSY